ncbi:MAG: orotate phosphoribosyltransferase [candidate division WOR-3 bacterium]
MKSEKEIEELLIKYEIFQKGHFLLTSGLHSEFYFEKSRIIQHPFLVADFSFPIKERFQKEKVDLVVGPTTGGAIIAYEVARQLGSRFSYAEKGETGGRKIRKGFEIKKGEMVLVVDDVLTTGGSIQETINALKEYQVNIVGVGVFIDRSPGVNFPFPFFACYRKEIKNYEPKSCPLCVLGIPLSIPGKGK